MKKKIAIKLRVKELKEKKKQRQPNVSKKNMLIKKKLLKNTMRKKRKLNPNWNGWRFIYVFPLLTVSFSIQFYLKKIIFLVFWLFDYWVLSLSQSEYCYWLRFYLTKQLKLMILSQLHIRLMRLFGKDIYLGNDVFIVQTKRILKQKCRIIQIPHEFHNISVNFHWFFALRFRSSSTLKRELF